MHLLHVYIHMYLYACTDILHAYVSYTKYADAGLACMEYAILRRRPSMTLTLFTK